MSFSCSFNHLFYSLYPMTLEQCISYLRPWPDSARTKGVCTLPRKTAPPTPVTFSIDAPTTTCSRSAEKSTPPRGSVIRKPFDMQSTRSSPTGCNFFVHKCGFEGKFDKWCTHRSKNLENSSRMEFFFPSVTSIRAVGGKTRQGAKTCRLILNGITSLRMFHSR